MVVAAAVTGFSRHEYEHGDVDDNIKREKSRRAGGIDAAPSDDGGPYMRSTHERKAVSVVGGRGNLMSGVAATLKRRRRTDGRTGTMQIRMSLTGLDAGYLAASRVAAMAA
jgi:hypothetical protein